jgi:hypothetical protein
LEVSGEDAWVAAQVLAGREEFMARFILGMYQAAHEGSSPVSTRYSGSSSAANP